MSFRFRRKPDGSVGHCTPGCTGLCDPDDFFHVEVAEFILAPNVSLPGGGTWNLPDLVLARLQCDITHIDPIPIRFLSEEDFDVEDAEIVIAGWGFEEPNSPPQCPPLEPGVCPVLFAQQVSD